MNNSHPKAALIIAFRRHANLSSQLKSLSEAGVAKIYIAVDAAPENDFQAAIDVALTLEIAKNVDLPNVIVRLSTHKTNVGCSAGVLSACDWFFSHEEFGVILEDDCIPTSDFFTFVDSARSLLDISNSWLICGTQFAPPDCVRSDWVQSKYPLIWGWATSRNIWNEISADLKLGEKGRLNQNQSKSENQYWRAGARRSSRGAVDAWDNILVYRMLLRSKFAILPRRTLVSNIGSDQVATHTPSTSKWLGLATGSFNLPESKPESSETLDLWLRDNFYKISRRHLITTRLTSIKDRVLKSSGVSLVDRWAQANRNLIEIPSQH